MNNEMDCTDGTNRRAKNNLDQGSDWLASKHIKREIERREDVEERGGRDSKHLHAELNTEGEVEAYVEEEEEIGGKEGIHRTETPALKLHAYSHERDVIELTNLAYTKSHSAQ